MEYEAKQESAPLHTTTEDTVLVAEEAEESSAWEAQVASRAGVRTSSKNPHNAVKSVAQHPQQT